ncbi:ABC-type nitrate/sulfonate/bicarbonate transport [Oleiphilus messinensis]|uniref:ABC-type nitrate/sulfonate/bicarbonate transport n=2 Tax=Oleiphilus messinensis TaxID=141451 RepID=A0A1Y0IHR4_9GAMM|nr:ABC-type nitrate/sulfonate/bicarbonate transport [Oleiphilus messinensis]
MITLFSLRLYGSESLVISVSKTPLSAPIFVADALGYFADEGLDITLTSVNGGHRSMQDVIAGRADFGTSSDMVIMNTLKSGKAINIYATFVSSSRDSGLIVNTLANVNNPTDLKGKRIGMTKGTSSHYFLDMFLLLAGLEPSDVDQVNVQPEKMTQALESQQVDAISTWEPWLTATILKLKSNATLLHDVNAYSLTFNLVSKRPSPSTKTVPALLKALLKAEAFIRKDSEKAKQIVAKRLQSDTPVLNRIWPYYDFTVRLDQSLVATIESQLHWSQIFGQTRNQSIKLLDAIDTTPLLEIAPSRVSIYK